MQINRLIFSKIAVLILWTPALAVTPADARREQMRQEAQASFGHITDALEGILQRANLNQRPDDQQIQRAAELLEENRRNVAVLDAPQKAVYMLLQSWTSYYQDDPATNMNWAMRACREDMTNGDAWISQTVFSLMYGRRPLEPQPPRPQRQQQPESRRPQRTVQPGRQAETTPDPRSTYNPNAPFGQPGTLEFDLNMLNREFLRERFVRQQYRTIDGRTISYVPGSDILCLLVWAVEEIQDPNQPGTARPAARESLEPQQPRATTAHDQAQYSLEAQQAYFEIITQVLAENSNVKFIEINTNSQPVARQAVADHYPVAPLVIAADPQSGAVPFSQLQVPVPFMAVIDKEGQVKYAGVANGFMPAFILTHITGTPIDLGLFVTTPDAHHAQPGMRMQDPGFGRARMPGRDMGRTALAVDPNHLPQDPNQIRPGRPDPTRQVVQQPQQPQQLRELPEHEQVAAEKKLTYVRNLYIQGSRLGVQSYKRGVDMCREIIRDYPNTKYAEEARQLLRQVPERQRRLYNVTDAELGL